jgi:hypothetical protein
MACRTGSVERVTEKSGAAKQQIDKLVQLVQAQEQELKDQFFGRIALALSDAEISDARQLGYNMDIKTEYTSEFSLEAIAAVVTSALTALIKSKSATVAAPLMTTAAIEAYKDVVNKVAEAAKSSSSAAASLSFSMNRLSPGIIAFLYAVSTNIQDKETFGTETITTTAIFYRLMESIDDVKKQVKFDLAVIEAKNLLDMKTVQAGLTDALADGKITIEEWIKKDDLYEKAVETIQVRLNALNFNTKGAIGAVKSKGSRASANQKLISDAIARLSKMDGQYNRVIEKSKQRLNTLYF